MNDDFSLEGICFEELLAHLNGEDLETYRKRQQERAMLWKAAEPYLNMPPEQWHPLTFNWDLAKESQRFALDGIDAEAFRKHYPQGFVLGWLRLSDFDKHLSHFSRRDGLEELWSSGDSSKLAIAIARFKHGLPTTPPLVAPGEDKNQVFLAGGHHRYTVAKFSGQERLPIYADPDHVPTLSQIIPVSWQT